MPTLIINNVPVSLLDRIQRLARAQQRTPADTALELLESAFRTKTPMSAESPLPQEPFLTEEICAPFEIAWPQGEIVMPNDIAELLPEPHDIPVTD
jgi:hypothetical protein